MAKLSSSNQKFSVTPKHLIKETVKNTQLGKKEKPASLQKTAREDLDSINLFNPPKTNPNGRLASSRLFEGDSTHKLPKNGAEPRNLWFISAISLILLVNIVSALVILKDKFSNLIENKELKATPEILVGKTNLAVQEFATPNLNSLSSISIKEKDQNQKASGVKAKVSLPIAIPPTNLPSKGIMDSSVPSISYYYILVKYTGEESLQLAQEQVNNVSLVNFPQGIFIYLGAFSQKTKAENFINQIKEKGLDGYIYYAQ